MSQIPQTLIEQMHHPDQNQRSAAILALGNMDHPDKLPLLIQALQTEPNLYVREDITYAIVRVGDSALPLLLDLLKDDRPDVRHHAAHVLGKMAHPDAVAALMDVLDDEAPMVAAKAVLALQQIGDPAAIPTLLRLLGHPHREVQAALQTAMQHFGTAAVDPLIRAVEHAQWQVREQAADSLGLIADEAAVPALLPLRQDAQWRVRFSVANALGHIGTNKAVSALREMRDDSDSRVRELVQRLLKSLKVAPAEPAALAEYHQVRFDDLAECAAFIAGLSRFLHNPEGSVYRFQSDSLEIWSCTRRPTEGVLLYLSTDALEAAAAAFGQPSVMEVRRGDRLTADCFFIMGRDAVEDWSMQDAKRHLLKSMLGR